MNAALLPSPALLDAFLTRWRDAAGSERANYQLFVGALCDVHPQLLEQAAGGPEILQVAAIGVRDPTLGEKVVVVVRGEAADVAAVRARIAAAGLVADEVVVSRDALPVDPRHNAKIDYAALRRRWEESP